MKSAYEDELRKRIDSLETRLGYLEKELADATSVDEHAALETKRDRMREVLDELEDRSKDTWDDLHERGERLWGEVRVLLDTLVRKYGIGDGDHGFP